MFIYMDQIKKIRLPIGRKIIISVMSQARNRLLLLRIRIKLQLQFCKLLIIKKQKLKKKMMMIMRMIPGTLMIKNPNKRKRLLSRIPLIRKLNQPSKMMILFQQLRKKLLLSFKIYSLHNNNSMQKRKKRMMVYLLIMILGMISMTMKRKMTFFRKTSPKDKFQPNNKNKSSSNSSLRKNQKKP